MTVINTNVGALMARTYAAQANNTMTRSMERLSSGQRINSAADDAAGLAVANKMESQSRGIKMAMRNSKDGISLVQTAESGMSQITNMLLRMRELAVQMDNGVYTSTDRDNAQLEINALLAEIDKIARNTRFNDVALLDGSYDQTIRSGNTNAETTRIKLDSMFVKDTGSGASSALRAGPETTVAADFSVNFVDSLAAQFGISANDYSSLQTSDSEALLSNLVSSNSFKQANQGDNLLLLKDKLTDSGYLYATVSLSDNQWAKVSNNLSQTKALYEEIAGLDVLETVRRGQIANSVEDLEAKRSEYIGSLFHANEIDIQMTTNGNLTNDKYAEIINVYSDPGTRQSIGSEIAAIEVDLNEVAKNLHDPLSCAHCLAQASAAVLNGPAINAMITDRNSSGSGAVGASVGSQATSYAAVTDKTTSGSGYASVSAPSSAAVSPLIMGARWTGIGDDSGTNNATNDLSYSYMGSGHNEATSYGYVEGVRTALEDAGTGNETVHNLAFDAWDDVSPFSLQEQDEDGTGNTVGDLRVAFSTSVSSGSAAHAYGPHPSAQGGDIYYGTTQMNTNGSAVDFVRGEHSYITALHEIGHALGLSHPFDGGSVDSSKMNLNIDTQRNTVMTYNQSDRNLKIHLNGGNAAFNGKVFMTTPGLLDIEAIEHIYGSTNWSANAADTTYGDGEGATEDVFNSNFEGLRVLSDSGGTDTLDASAVAADAYGKHSIINLTPGTYSSINTYATDLEKITAVSLGDAGKIASFESALATQNTAYSASNSYYPDFTRTALYRGQQNVGIAHHTWIENAKGGGGNDTITGNNKGNEITGNGGNDTIDGSGGVDMAIYDENYANYAVSNSSGTVTVNHTGGAADEGADTLTNIEYLKFADGIYTVATSTFASGAADPALSGTETGGVTGGAVEGEDALNISTMTLKDIGIKTQAEAQAAITILNKSLQDIATGRAKLGAVSNRLSHNLDNQTKASMMTQQARGRVVDTDMAVESTKLAQEQILSQAAQQAINMATQRQQTVLMLLGT
ncbi:flagellin [Alphaproteobacteria bacterium]|nr:flagellin [Alphaproteobacteria bacterium]